MVYRQNKFIKSIYQNTGVYSFRFYTHREYIYIYIYICIYTRPTSKYGPVLTGRSNVNKNKYNPFMAAYEIKLKRELTLKIE